MCDDRADRSTMVFGIAVLPSLDDERQRRKPHAASRYADPAARRCQGVARARRRRRTLGARTDAGARNFMARPDARPPARPYRHGESTRIGGDHMKPIHNVGLTFVALLAALVVA